MTTLFYSGDYALRPLTHPVDCAPGVAGMGCVPYNLNEPHPSA